MTDTPNKTPEVVVSNEPVPEVAPVNGVEMLDIPEFLRRQAAEDQKLADAFEQQQEHPAT